MMYLAKAGKIRARRIGRHWMMTDADMEHALEVFSNPAAAVEIPATPAAESYSAGVPSLASMRRRQSA